MDTLSLTRIRAALYEGRQATTQALLDGLAQVSPVPVDATALEPRLMDVVENLIQALAAETWDVTAVQQVGKALEAFDNVQPDGLLKLHEALLTQWLAQLEPGLQLDLYPRLCMLLSALLTGFFVGKAERAKQFDMEAMSKMGHDLKTPINAITGFSRVILKGIDGPITDFQKEDLTSIFEAGQKLLTMINDLFETAKSDARKARLYSPTFEVAELLGDLMSVGQPAVAKAQHVLAVQGGGSLGAMRANASQVRWILLSLLLYAGRLSEARTITLTAQRQRINEADVVRFEITEPLPNDVVARLKTTPSIQADGTVSENAEVGLITCQRFCEALGAKLSMELGETSVKLIAQIPAYVASNE